MAVHTCLLVRDVFWVLSCRRTTVVRSTPRKRCHTVTHLPVHARPDLCDPVTRRDLLVSPAQSDFFFLYQLACFAGCFYTSIYSGCDWQLFAYDTNRAQGTRYICHSCVSIVGQRLTGTLHTSCTAILVRTRVWVETYRTDVAHPRSHISYLSSGYCVLHLPPGFAG